MRLKGMHVNGIPSGVDFVLREFPLGF